MGGTYKIIKLFVSYTTLANIRQVQHLHVPILRDENGLLVYNYVNKNA